ncbi:hypothetical protein P9452_12830, partial [Bacillus mycoides]|nr:hypothetical protein [Bacillus mycoides]
MSFFLWSINDPRVPRVLLLLQYQLLLLLPSLLQFHLPKAVVAADTVGIVVDPDAVVDLDVGVDLGD